LRFHLGVILAMASAGAFSAMEVPLRVPSDSKATYYILEKGGKGHMRTIVTKRVGPSGTSYSKRLFDCNQGTVKYLGTGDTLAQMNAGKPDAKMTPVADGSIASYVGGAACAK
jgi:hypothetical protein